MSNGKDIEVKISASTSAVEAGMKRAADVVHDAMKRIHKDFEATTSALSGGMNVNTKGLETSQERVKKVLNETKSSAESYKQKQNELNQTLTGAVSSVNAVHAALNKLDQSLKSLSSNVASSAASVQNAMRKLDESLKNLSTGTNNSSKGVNGLGASFAMLGRFAIAATLAEAARQSILVMSSFEQLEMRMRSVMGSSKQAETAFDWIKKFAKETPFEVDEVSKSFMMLKNFGLDPMDGTLQALADQAAKNGGGFENLQRVTLGLGQAWTKGKLQGEEALQLLEAGVPVWQMLANITGKSTQEVQKLSEQGRLGKDVIRALIEEIGRTSKGASAAQMETLSGQFSNLKDNVKNSLDEVRKSGGLEFLKDGLKKVNDYFEEISNNGKLKQWADEIGKVLDVVGEAFGALLDLIKAVFSIIDDAFNTLTDVFRDETGKQANYLDLIKFALDKLRVGFIAIKMVIQLAMEFVRYIVQGVASDCIKAFVMLKGNTEIAFEYIKSAVMNAVLSLSTFAEVAKRAFMLDFDGAKNAWKQGLEDIENQVEQSAKRIQALRRGMELKLDAAEPPKPKYAQILNDANDQIKRQGKYQPKEKEKKDDPEEDKNKGGGTTNPPPKLLPDDKKGKEETRLAGWEAALAKEKEVYAQRQAAAGTFHEYSLQDEINYWSKLKGRQDLSEKERNSVDKKYYEALGAQRKKNFEGHIASLKTELDSIQYNQDERLRIANQIADEIGQKYGLESKEYQAAQQQIVQIARQKQQQIKQIEAERESATLAQRQFEVDMAEQMAQIEVELGHKTSEELLANQRQFEAQRYAIALDGINQRKALLEGQGDDMDVVEHQRLLGEKAVLDQQYALKKKSLDLKSTQDSMKYWKGFQSSMENVYSNGLNQMLAGTLSFKNAMKGLFREIARNFVQELVTKRLAAWASAQTQELAMTAMTKAKQLLIGNTAIAQETAAKAAGATTQEGVVAGGAMAEIGAKGASAGAGAASSVAGIPIVGPVLAVAAMAAVLGSVLALKGKVKSASGGYSIPRGLNPLTQLHEEEMVLPKAESSVIRDLAIGKVGKASGGDSSSGSGGHNIQFNIQAMDSTSVKKLLTNNKSAVHEAMKKQLRNFAK